MLILRLKDEDSLSYENYSYAEDYGLAYELDGSIAHTGNNEFRLFASPSHKNAGEFGPGTEYNGEVVENGVKVLEFFKAKFVEIDKENNRDVYEYKERV